MSKEVLKKIKDKKQKVVDFCYYLCCTSGSIYTQP